MQVQAVDSGTPVQQTATATVSIFVEDVNNKPPKFTQESYVQYIPESKSWKIVFYSLFVMNYINVTNFTFVNIVL